MNDIVPFQFRETSIRVICGADGKPWWVAGDVCSALDIGNVSMTLSRLDDDERGISAIDTPGGRQQVATVNEPGLYSLILTSRKPEAKAFKRWIVHEVIPALRKTGAYAISTDPLDVLQGMIDALRRQERRLNDHDARLTRMEAVQEAQAGGPQMLPIVAWVKINNLAFSDRELVSLGKKLTAYSQEHGFPIGKVHNSVYGQINTYHIDALRLFISQERLIA